VEVSFPAGALPRNTTVSLGYNSGTLTPKEGTFSGCVLVLNTQFVSDFAMPVSITVPFTGTTKVPVPYYVDEAGKLHPVQLVVIDRTAGTFTFQTFHASLYTWIFGDTATLQQDTVAKTDFDPAKDSFQIANNGSIYNSDGECFGMTSFALWYYMTQKGTKGDFYPKYMGTIGNDFLGNPMTGQRIIASRSFISISHKWETYYKNLTGHENELSMEDQFVSIKNILMNTGNPVMLYLCNNFSNLNKAHSILAYSWNGLTAELSCYDPNFPGSTKVMKYIREHKVIIPYEESGFDKAVYSGDGSIRWDEPYGHILEDADKNFHDSAEAVIDITSHASGDEVDTRNITLTGTIGSGLILVKHLIVYVGSIPFVTDVDLDGHFRITVSLEQGINHLQFVTKGRDANYNMVEIPSNMLTEDFTIKCTTDDAIMLVTLNWDTADTDVDLYVIDPIGYCSYFREKVTADGGELDYDITYGYGPEHWTLTYRDTIRYGDPYKVRLHYYNDNDNGPTNYTVSIKLYEGTSRERTYSYRGNLSVDDYSNEYPWGTGDDWVDIATIILSETDDQPSGPQFLTKGLTGALQITVPVPSGEQRAKAKLQ
jgi:uncharacterized protein YfaP (DUF2135 family)